MIQTMVCGPKIVTPNSPLNKAMSVNRVSYFEISHLLEQTFSRGDNWLYEATDRNVLFESEGFACKEEEGIRVSEGL